MGAICKNNKNTNENVKKWKVGLNAFFPSCTQYVANVFVILAKMMYKKLLQK